MPSAKSNRGPKEGRTVAQTWSLTQILLLLLCWPNDSFFINRDRRFGLLFELHSLLHPLLSVCHLVNVFTYFLLLFLFSFRILNITTAADTGTNGLRDPLGPNQRVAAHAIFSDHIYCGIFASRKISDGGWSPLNLSNLSNFSTFLFMQ